MKNKQVFLYACITAAIAALPSIVLAQNVSADNAALADIQTAETPRVSQTIDNKILSTIENSHLTLISAVKPTAAVDDSTPMNHMQLVLKRSALRQTALDALITAQHDAHSSKFHHWLTPEQYGQTFGVADSDIAAVTSWLVSQGFTVHGVYPNKMQIDFSGTAGQVKQAFHTQENRYTINQASHIANASDISLPAALKDVVTGVAGLNDLHPQAMHLPPKVTQFDHGTQRFQIVPSKSNVTSMARVSPDAVTSPSTSGVRGLVPYDMAKIYSVDQLHAQGITGKGITIAVVEDDGMVSSDWTTFVSQFNLGSYGGTFAQIQPQATGMTNCLDPGGTTATTESIETLMDAEWSTAMAPGAHVEVASCDDSNGQNFFGGVFTAATNLINGSNRPDVISASYGYGEDQTDAASKTAIDLMWAQADVEGISVFISTGDSGSNPDFNGSLINGTGVSANSLATSPNVTGVGGTDIADELDHTTAQYFSPTLNAEYGSAKSYVPEIPWNWSCGNDVAAKSLGFASAVAFCKQNLAVDPSGYYANSEAGSGGPSSVDRKPAWQRQVHNAAKDQSRDLPDVALYAGSYANATAVIICTAAEPCTPGFTTPVVTEGGTSLSSPMFAGIQALIDQGLAAKGLSQDQGNAAPTLYALAEQEYGGASGNAPASLAACSADYGTKGTGGCAFHNITRGSNSTQCVQIAGEVTPDCYFYGNIANLWGQYGPAKIGLTSTSTSQYNAKTSAYAAQSGWSFASGLGSVNAKNLLAAWKTFVDAP